MTDIVKGLAGAREGGFRGGATTACKGDEAIRFESVKVFAIPLTFL